MSRRQGARRAIGLLEPALIVGAALVALTFHLRLPSRLATAEDWQALGAHLEAHAAPDDAVVLHPWWTDEARLHVPEPLVIWSDPHNATRDLEESPRLWLVSQPRLPRARTAAFEAGFLPGREALGPPLAFGTLVLTSYRNLRHRPAAFRATEDLPRARVFLEDVRNGRTRPCRPEGGGFRCPGPARVEVSVGWREIDFAPVRCLSLPPPGGTERLVVEFPAPAPAALLRLEGGLVGEDAVQRAPGLDAVAFGVEDGQGRPLLGATLTPGTEGLVREERAFDAGETGPLRLWSRSERPERRSLCVRLAALGAPLGAEGTR